MFSYKTLFSSCLLAHLAFAGAIPAKWTVGQGVMTSSGHIIGHPAPNASHVSEYLAIPYAQPPIGPLRFAAPAKYTSTKTVNATSFNLICPHVTVGLPGVLIKPPADPVQFKQYIQSISNGPYGFDEDCLYLNVWTKPQTGDAKKAVMIWIHPGGFRSGGTNNVGMSGQHYADLHDVCVNREEQILRSRRDQTRLITSR
jgi:cholinesterase